MNVFSNLFGNKNQRVNIIKSMILGGMVGPKKIKGFLAPEHGKEAWFDDAGCPPNTAELWRVNLSTPQNFSPRDCID